MVTATVQFAQGETIATTKMHSCSPVMSKYVIPMAETKIVTRQLSAEKILTVMAIPIRAVSTPERTEGESMIRAGIDHPGRTAMKITGALIFLLISALSPALCQAAKPWAPASRLQKPPRTYTPQPPDRIRTGQLKLVGKPAVQPPPDRIRTGQLKLVGKTAVQPPPDRIRTGQLKLIGKPAAQPAPDRIRTGQLKLVGKTAVQPPPDRIRTGQLKLIGKPAAQPAPDRIRTGQLKLIGKTH